MDRDKFIRDLAIASDEIDEEYYKNMIAKSVEHNGCGNLGYATGPVICIEEMSELSEEISRKLRGREDANTGLLEEIADVSICISILQRCFNISDSDLHKAINVKLHRFEEKIKNADKYSPEVIYPNDEKM